MGQRAGRGGALPDQGVEPGAIFLGQDHDVLLAHARLLQPRETSTAGAWGRITQHANHG
jgi:hypothetical protein